MKIRAKFALIFVFTICLGATEGWAQSNVAGYVYWDENQNGILDKGETGVSDVCVSNGREVVQSGVDGSYRLPAYEDMVVFVIKPSGWMTSMGLNNIPRFSYVHKPGGSPPEIKRFRGVAPTGPLPDQIDFALYKVNEPDKFQVAVIGDPQVYNHQEIDYLKNSLVAEIQNSEALFCIVEGDSVGDDLSLFPRYLEEMGKMGLPVYYVPGNHDMNYEARSDNDSLDTFKSYVGATYYAFNYGKVHFVVLDAMEYPSRAAKGSYTGKIDKTQMEWLANDLAFVPMDHLVVLNMHIPLVSDINRMNAKHQVDNRQDVYELLKGRRAISLAGHTHTLARFLPGDELEGWGQPTPIEQTIVGAASGSWWSGDPDSSGVPSSYMRCGAPRGHMLFDFNQDHHSSKFRAHARPLEQQMHLSFFNQHFNSWFDAIAGDDTGDGIATFDYPDILSSSDLVSGSLVANIWSASKHAQVQCRFDDRQPVAAQWNMDLKDPLALAAQLYVSEGGLDSGSKDQGKEPSTATDNRGPLARYYWTVEGRSTHLWQCSLPSDLEPGTHTVSVKVENGYGKIFEQTKSFKVSDS